MDDILTINITSATTRCRDVKSEIRITKPRLIEPHDNIPEIPKAVLLEILLTHFGIDSKIELEFPSLLL